MRWTLPKVVRRVMPESKLYNCTNMDILIISSIIAAIVSVSLLAYAFHYNGSELVVVFGSLGILASIFLAIGAADDTKYSHLVPVTYISFAKADSAIIVEGDVLGEHKTEVINDVFMFQHIGQPGYVLYVRISFNHFGSELKRKFELVKE